MTTIKISLWLGCSPPGLISVSLPAGIDPCSLWAVRPYSVDWCLGGEDDVQAVAVLKTIEVARETIRHHHPGLLRSFHSHATVDETQALLEPPGYRCFENDAHPLPW